MKRVFSRWNFSEISYIFQYFSTYISNNCVEFVNRGICTKTLTWYRFTFGNNWCEIWTKLTQFSSLNKRSFVLVNKRYPNFIGGSSDRKSVSLVNRNINYSLINKIQNKEKFAFRDMPMSLDLLLIFFLKCLTSLKHLLYIGLGCIF